MGGVTFTPLTRNWRWFQNNAAEPTVSYAAENTAYTGSFQEGTVLRLRFNVAETGGKSNNGTAIAMQYSLDQTNWLSFGAGADWNYGNGLATNGGTVTSLLLSDTNTNALYIESGANLFNFTGTTNNEFDYAITPGTAFTDGSTYYFRAVIAGTGRATDTGETYPQITPTYYSVPRKITLSSPGNGANNIRIDTSLNWVADSSSDSYWVQLDDAGAFTSNIIDASGFTTPYYQVSPDLNNSTTYYWRAAGLTTLDACIAGTWSDTWSFTTLATAHSYPNYVNDLISFAYINDVSSFITDFINDI